MTWLKHLLNKWFSWISRDTHHHQRAAVVNPIDSEPKDWLGWTPWNALPPPGNCPVQIMMDDWAMPRVVNSDELPLNNLRGLYWRPAPPPYPDDPFEKVSPTP